MLLELDFFILSEGPSVWLNLVTLANPGIFSSQTIWVTLSWLEVTIIAEILQEKTKKINLGVLQMTQGKKMQ